MLGQLLARDHVSIIILEKIENLSRSNSKLLLSTLCHVSRQTSTPTPYTQIGDCRTATESLSRDSRQRTQLSAATVGADFEKHDK